MLTVNASATYAVPASPERLCIICDATSGAFTATLPDAVANPGIERAIIKKDAGANAITIATTSSQTILTTSGAATTASLAAQGNAITVVSNGTNWDQLSKV